jgi:hypothetical protein
VHAAALHRVHLTRAQSFPSVRARCHLVHACAPQGASESLACRVRHAVIRAAESGVGLPLSCKLVAIDRRLCAKSLGETRFRCRVHTRQDCTAVLRRSRKSRAVCLRVGYRDSLYNLVLCALQAIKIDMSEDSSRRKRTTHMHQSHNNKEMTCHNNISSVAKPN